MPLVSIVTINYNSHKDTEELLVSIPRNTPGITLEIIVVDNGSNFNPVPEWKTKFPAVTFIRSKSNLGFAGGNNLGITYAKGDYLFLVNNDTVFTADLLSKLIASMEISPGIGVVSPKICYWDNPKIIQYAGFTEMNFFTGRNRCVGQFQQDEGQFNSGKTAYAHGAAMMLRREVTERAGIMPEIFFLYYEEMDWCERIRAAGFEIWVNTEAVIHHKESVSVGTNSPLKEFFMNRNRILFIRRNATAVQRVVFYFYFAVVVSPRNIFRYLMKKDTGLLKAFCRAVIWNLTNGINSTF